MTGILKVQQATTPKKQPGSRRERKRQQARTELAPADITSWLAIIIVK
jgi:hypothetical protein